MAAVVGLATQTDARPWKPTPGGLALDYLQILDQRSNSEVVLVWWVAPPMLSDANAKDILDKYVVIAVVDAHIDPVGAATYNVGKLELQDASGQSLKQLADADMPPNLTGAVSSLRAMMSQMLGQMGKGMQLFAFDAGSVRACGKGRLAVLYAGETYTYDTPIPGCPAN